MNTGTGSSARPPAGFPHVQIYGKTQEEHQVTDEERARHVRALIEERRGYEVRGQVDRVAQVDASLTALGVEGKAPAKRAEKRKVS